MPSLHARVSSYTFGGHRGRDCILVGFTTTY